MANQNQPRLLPTGQPLFLQDNDLRIIFFGGKGGVGKTTCAAGTAWRMALNHPEDSFLVVSTDPAHSLLDSVADSSIPPNLSSLELAPDKCLDDFKARFGQTLKTIAARGTFLEDDDISSLLDLSLPGLDELMAFLEIAGWLEEGRYRCIVVDTAPTGHTLRLLQMAELIRKWLAAMDVLLAKHRYMKAHFSRSYQPDEIDDFLINFSESVAMTEALLQDSTRCCFVPVMVAEALSIRETGALLDELRRLKIATSEIVINMLYPELPCPICAAHRSRQDRQLENLWNEAELTRYTLWGVPLYPDEMRGASCLEAFWINATQLDRPVEKPWLQAPPFTSRIEAAPMLPPPETRLLFFGGKGGVGKTTLACATALKMAQDEPALEVFLFSIDPAHSLSLCLGTDIGGVPVKVTPRLTALEIDAQVEFENLKTRYISEIRDALTGSGSLDLTFDREVMERMLDLAPPGLDEVMALTRGLDLLERGGYDIVVFDSAPTGHMLRLLELPELIDQWLKVIFNILIKYREVIQVPELSARLVRLSRSLKIFRQMLTDPNRSALYAVAILSEMAFQETRDMVSACNRLSVDVRALFLNLATADGECPLCSALHERENRIKWKFQDSFSNIHQTLIYRSGEPQGLEKLLELGRGMFKPPQGV